MTWHAQQRHSKTGQYSVQERGVTCLAKACALLSHAHSQVNRSALLINDGWQKLAVSLLPLYTENVSWMHDQYQHRLMTLPGVCQALKLALQMQPKGGVMICHWLELKAYASLLYPAINTVTWMYVDNCDTFVTQGRVPESAAAGEWTSSSCRSAALVGVLKCTETLVAEHHPLSQYLVVPVTEGDTTSMTAELCALHSRLLLLPWHWRRLSAKTEDFHLLRYFV